MQYYAHADPVGARALNADFMICRRIVCAYIEELD